MKLERVALRNFLSHRDTDWLPNGARLVSLVGANGAGKSTLLDAIAFCLYDSARGRTDDLVQLGQTDMSARVEFTFAGCLYAVERGRTTRAGGKSYLEFQVRDGEAWRPLTGDTIRETQERITALLRMDAATFASAALLMQGRLNAFAEATPAERKRVLGQILGLDVYARAEQVARGRVRDLEARTGAERDQLARLDERLAERAEAERDRDYARSHLELLSADVVAAVAAREAARGRVAELDAQLASADAQRRLVNELRGRVVSLQETYVAARGRHDMAQAAITRAQGAITAGAGAAEAVAALPGARDRLASLEGLRDQVAQLERTIRDRREAHNAAAAEHRQTAATWAANYKAARSRVDELQAAHAAMVPVPCPKCGAPVTPDGGDLVRRLSEAKRAFIALERDEPKTPISIAREEGELLSLSDRLTRLAFDPAELRAAEAEVRRLVELAAQADRVADARASLTEAEAAAAAAIAEMASTTEQGRAARDAVTEAQAKLDELAPVATQRIAAAQALDVAARTVTEAEERVRTAQAAESRAIAQLEQLERVGAEREALAATVAAADAEAGILRRLVSAFGVSGIPARIVEGVLPELEANANALLADLRPGMSLAIRAQRAKKDGKGVVEALDLVVRDAAGERPLALFSGGERTSVSLSLAVGLSRLVARRAGTAVRSLVVDEPDGLDAESRRAFGQALRILAHQGELERVVVVSHHEDLAEAGDAIYQVTKRDGVSAVAQVA